MSEFEKASKGAQMDFAQDMSYGDYLGLDAILSAQIPLSDAHAAGWLVVVKEALANGRLAGGSAEAPVREVARVDGQATDAFALGSVMAKPWAGLVLSGAVTAEQLGQNLAARPPHTDADALAALALDPVDYWADRSARAWG